MQPTLHTYIDDNTLFIDIPDEFDSFKVDLVRDHLDAIATQQSGDVTLNFEMNQFLDSSGIGAIVFLYKRLRARGRQLQLINVAGQPLKLMTMLHVDRAIPLNQKSDQVVA
jgi:anti-anti-sigma factor